MACQDINILIEFDPTTRAVSKCKIIKNVKDLVKTSKIALLEFQNESTDLIGECDQCSEEFEIFVYGLNSNETLSSQCNPVQKYEEELVNFEANAVKEEICIIENYVNEKSENDETLHEKDEPKKLRKWNRFGNKGKKHRKSEVRSPPEIIPKTDDGYLICTKCKSEFYCGRSYSKHKNICDGTFLGRFLGGPNPRCSHCNKMFTTWSSARFHEKTEHTGTIFFKCDICGYGTRYKSSMNAHEQKGHSNDPKPFVCDLCAYRCGSKNSMITHMKMDHLKQHLFKCDFCPFESALKCILRIHVKTHSKNDKEQMNKSGKHNAKKVFNENSVKFHDEIERTKSDILKDLVGAKNDNKNEQSKDELNQKSMTHTQKEDIQITHDGYLICPKCKSEFYSTVALAKHKNVCDGKFLGRFLGGPNPRCTYCNKSFINWSLARVHEKRDHTKTISYTCEVCGYNTKFKSSMDLHRLKGHTNDPKPFICDLCGYKGGSRNVILMHMNKKHLKKNIYKCEVCPFESITKTFLKTHMIKHDTFKKYSCSLCDQKFKYQPSLSLHEYRVHHIGQRRKTKIFYCDQCDYQSEKRHNFEIHKSKHEGGPKHFCHICNKSMLTKYILRAHMRCHTEDRPFKCNFCEKSFKRNSDLTMHTRYHTGEKPYECEICGQRYSDRGCYRSHLMVHEKQLGITLDKSVRKFLDKVN